jgi:hypothetical protein
VGAAALAATPSPGGAARVHGPCVGPPGLAGLRGRDIEVVPVWGGRGLDPSVRWDDVVVGWLAAGVVVSTQGVADISITSVPPAMICSWVIHGPSKGSPFKVMART